MLSSSECEKLYIDSSSSQKSIVRIIWDCLTKQLLLVNDEISTVNAAALYFLPKFRKYNESRHVDHARFNDETDNENYNDETDNENHNDEIINGEPIPIYSFIVLKIFIYDGLSRGNSCYCEHIKDDPCFNGATSAQNCK
ncbi:hypothetical protein TNCV_4063941 [Trichonephila clavipes]|nr:hypothetical protein TNCV_4063941 [Trichonephila clavipes]